ncbi:MAG: M67 family metallopeptidase [Tannerellaceae bacterium]|jgi:proteasome lid subunit RPN8/RPN11|nr:M67 family metallopeptidase [Tannerellaceae bacterium]
MIKIPEQIIEAILRQAYDELPNEACGLLAGAGDVVCAHYPLTNTDHSPEHFSFDPQEQFLVLRDARSHGWKIIACYHSHPASPARPSVEDIRLAYDPKIGYLIVSLATHPPVIKAFRIIDGRVTEEMLE